MNMLSSFVGAWIAIVLFAVAAVLVVVGIVGSLSTGVENNFGQVKKRSILVLDLNGPIEEREMALEPDLQTIMSGNLKAPQTLDVICEALREGAKNDNIVMLYIKCGSVAAAPATLNAIRQEVEAFKKSGKKVYAYADMMSQGAYFVASAADKVYMNPAGEVELHGIGGQSLYFKDLFDKLGVEFQVVKVGTYKSAVEPYILSDMSAPARAQLDTLYGVMWEYLRKEMSADRKALTAAKIDSLINRDHITFAPAKFAVESGVIDSLIYEREMDAKLAGLVGVEKEKLNFVAPSTLVAQTPWAQAYSSKNQIAVLFACGEIADGDNNNINYETLVPEIVRLAEDDNVKGMVLRVNSPGGSVYGSTQIGEALDYFQSKGKPLAVSMGDYAASGGYWISACADKIFADPLTITGSIGIFGLIPNFKGTMDKLGVHAAEVSTNPGENFPNGYKPMDAAQLAVMQKYVERGYDEFTNRVAKGRKMSVAAVKRIAEGRVWNAQTAVKIGLVDSIAYLQNAVEWVASKAKIQEKYDIAAYPQVEQTIWNQIMLQGTSMSELAKACEVRDEAFLQKYLIRRILSRKPIQARMPEIGVML